jgi:hypothetical protein
VKLSFLFHGNPEHPESVTATCPDCEFHGSIPPVGYG